MNAESRYIPTGKLIRCPSCSAELAMRYDVAVSLERIDGSTKEAFLRQNGAERASDTLSIASERGDSALRIYDVQAMLNRKERLPTWTFNKIVKVCKDRGLYRYGPTMQEIFASGRLSHDDIMAIEQAVNE